MKIYYPILLLIILVGCSGEKSGQAQTAGTPDPSKKTVDKTDPVLIKGEQVFKSYCMACHMSKGEGIPNLNPPLTRTKYTLGDKKVMIEIVIKGLEGEIEVLDKKYNSFMTPFGFLSDEDIAAVTTYVRSNFGNDADGVSPEDVAAVRESLKE